MIINIKAMSFLSSGKRMRHLLVLCLKILEKVTRDSKASHSYFSPGKWESSLTWQIFNKDGLKASSFWCAPVLWENGANRLETFCRSVLIRTSPKHKATQCLSRREISLPLRSKPLPHQSFPLPHTHFPILPKNIAQIMEESLTVLINICLTKQQLPG